MGVQPTRVLAHGVVGLSDAPITSQYRPVMQSPSVPDDSARPENLPMTTNPTNTVMGLSGDIRTVEAQARFQPSTVQAASQPSSSSDGLVNIVRSGARPSVGTAVNLSPQPENASQNGYGGAPQESEAAGLRAATRTAVPTNVPLSGPQQNLGAQRSENRLAQDIQTSSHRPLVSDADAWVEIAVPVQEAAISDIAPEPIMPESVTSETVFSATDSQNGRVEETRPIAIEFQHNPSMRSALERANELPAESSAAPVIAASSAPSAAADQKGMSILEAVERTIAWHPTIGEALGRLYQQGEQVSVARSGYYPQVSAGVATERRSSTGRSEDAVTVSASQMLYDFGRVSSQVDAANFGVNRDQARVWLAMDQLARDAAQAAIEVQRYQALLDIAREQIAGLTDIQKLAARRSELGASTRSDEIQAQSRVEAAKATELQIEAQLLTWQNTVRTLVGASGPVNINRDFPEPLTQSCALASEDFDNVPELMVAEAEQAEARAIIAQTQASFFPTVSLDADLNQFLNRDVAEDDTEVIMRVNLSSNLYQGGATSARRRAADYSLQASQAAKDAAYLSLSRSLREAKEQTASFGLRLVTLDARARSIRDTQQLYRQQYLSLGTRSLLDLLNAEQEIHQSRFDQENTRYDLYRLQIDCLYSSADIRDAFGLEDSMVQGVSVSP